MEVLVNNALKQTVQHVAQLLYVHFANLDTMYKPNYLYVLHALLIVQFVQLVQRFLFAVYVMLHII